jgi:hypothetical protein
MHYSTPFLGIAPSGRAHCLPRKPDRLSLLQSIPQSIIEQPGTKLRGYHHHRHRHAISYSTTPVAPLQPRTEAPTVLPAFSIATPQVHTQLF